jgi:arginine decarboxylase
MANPQDQTPLVDAVLAALKTDSESMQIPGHKSRYRSADAAVVGADILAPLLRDDVPLQGGADDNHFTHGYLAQAEKLYADAIGAARTRFLVGGSSQGNIAAFLTIASDGTPIAVDRTSHRSALAGLVLSGASPTWIYPDIHPEFGIPAGMPVAALAGLQKETAVSVTSPAYVGTISDIASLVTASHRDGRIVAVDQAWGAHLDFGVPHVASALKCGADLVVTSTHKALMGYTQTATISMSARAIDAARLDRSVDTTATTSPSATLLASIDATRAVMLRDGVAAMDRALDTASQARAMLRRVDGVVVVDDSNAGVHVDPLKVTLWLPRTGLTGTAIADMLWSEGHGVESADNDTLVMTVSVASTLSEVLGVMDKIVGFINTHRQEARASMPSGVWTIRPEVVMTPRAAVFAPRRRINLRDAAGEISAEQFCPYPPGVPLLGPGERVTREVIDAIETAGKSGRVAYCSDSTLKTIEVVAQ